MSEERLTQELHALLEPLGVRLEASASYKQERAYPSTGARAMGDRLPGILSLAVTLTPEGTRLVVCWPTRRSASLSHKQLVALDMLLKQVRQHLPPWVPTELLSLEAEAERDIAVATLRIEPCFDTPNEVARLIAAAPVVVLTRDALESLCIAIRCRLARLDYEAACCFYATQPGALQSIHHLMPSGRTLRHPALCGVPAPISEQCYAPHWWLLPIPSLQEPGQVALNRGIHLCTDCLACWQAMRQAMQQQQREGQQQ